MRIKCFTYLLLMIFATQNSFSATDIWFIHNSPDTIFSKVAVSLDNGMAIDTIYFRQQHTFYIDSLYTGNVNIRSLIDTNQSYTQSVSWEDSSSYIAILSGLENVGYATNPDGISTAMTLQSIDEGTLLSPSLGNTALLFSHGGTDFPICDITQYPGTLAIDDFSYGEVEDILRESISYNFNMLTRDSSLLMVTFRANLGNYNNKRVVIVTSGFLRPSANNNGKYFGMYLVNRDSLNFQGFSNVTPVKVQDKVAYKIFPNPCTDFLQIQSASSLLDKQISIFSSEGKLMFILNINSEDKIYNIPLHHLRKGIYWLTIDDSTVPFIKD